MPDFSTGLAALASPAAGIPAPNPLAQITEAAAQFPQLQQKAQLDQATNQAAVMTQQNAQKEQATKALSQLVSAAQANPTLENNPQWRQRTMQLYKLVTGSDQLPSSSNPTTTPAGGGAAPGAMAGVNAAPGQLAAKPAMNQPGAAPGATAGAQAAQPTPGQPGASVGSAPAQAAAQPGGVDLGALTFGGTNPLADPTTYSTIMQMEPEARKAWAQNANVKLSDFELNSPAMPPPMTASERNLASRDLYDSFKNIAQGTLTPQGFLDWATLNKRGLQGIGVDNPVDFLKASGGLEQLGAAAQARIDALTKTGILTQEKANELKEKLPYEIANIRTTDDLRNAQAKFYGERTRLMPLDMQNKWNNASRRADAAVSQAQTAAARLTEKVREFNQTGGVTGKGGAKAFSAAKQQVSELRSQANFIKGQITQLQSLGQYQVLSGASPDQVDQTNAELQRLIPAQKHADELATQAENSLDDAMKKGFQTSGMPGTVTDVSQKGGGSFIPGPVDTGLLAKFKAASASDQAATLNDSGFASLSSATQAALRAAAGK